ncbi:MAG: hypothetical protein ACRD0Z_00500 [Acidimicrobiales bacterium]
MTPRLAKRFAYESFEIDRVAGELRCSYSLDEQHFSESISLPATAGLAAWDSNEVRAAARWVFLLAGVSYYKAGAPPEIDLRGQPLSSKDMAFLRAFYLDGLGEFAYRNDLDLSGLSLRGAAGLGSAEATEPAPVGIAPRAPLVCFGGGIDSIVTTELVRGEAGDSATCLFIVSRKGDRFAAIEDSAAVSRLPVVRAERELDDAIVHSTQLGYLNGHVPVTGIVSAIAVLAAALHDRDAVVMSNEASASVGNVVSNGRVMNHQWSKSIAFETGFRAALAGQGVGVDYFSLLRPVSELWVARRFAELPAYHRTFRSCNKAFFVNPTRRLDHWCGECDKCCFVDLVLAPFMDRLALESVFGGREPLSDKSLGGKFRVLLALSSSPKPWDCVGDTSECRAALRLAVRREDRRDTELLHELAAELDATATIPDPLEAREAIGIDGPHFIPDAYAPGNLLV